MSYSKASVCKLGDERMHYVDDELHGPPGAFIFSGGHDRGSTYILCCPNCGAAGAPREGQKWTPTEGGWDDVTTLSLAPSIQKGCKCRWHGHLVKGEFVPCADWKPPTGVT